ncbi:MAG: hypothetical protein JSW58_15145 [Candidatus Latescibacterota bacterium]|nr:MAG: hypothetical protein JSW58_15145 [Candidatus Latescibacterota bacterium]
MKAVRVPPLIIVLAGLFVVSCSDHWEPDPIIPPIKNPPGYKDLTERDHVLFNLQKAYIERNLVRFDMLLDSDFVFHFSQADYQEGRVPVEQWEKAREIFSAQNIFDRNFSKPGVDPVSKIDLTLTYVAGEDRWTEVTPEDQITYPNETWYEKTVRYDLIVTSGPIDYTGLNILASFTVRMDEVNGEQIWRIISWRDDAEYQVAARLADPGALDRTTEETTWGSVKALYGE